MIELIVIIFLLLLNGLLAMSEIAFVSAKKFKLEELAKRNNTSAKKALLLLNDPEKFLSAVQTGITLVGILAGAYGGYAMAEDLSPYLERIEFLKQYSSEISFTLIVTLITYLSLVIGELVPKSIALNYPEKITVLMAPLMYSITKIFSPVVSFLSASTKMLLFIIRIKKSEEPPVTEDELKSLLELGAKHGTFEKEESEMINRIFSFNDKKVSSIMIPRTEIEWIDSSMKNAEIFQFITTHFFSKYIICEKHLDKFIGYIESKEFLIKYHLDISFDLKSIIIEPLVVPESIYSFDLLEKFRVSKNNIALVVDEHGGTQGLITLHDLFEDLFGDLPDKFEEAQQNIVRRKDGSLLIDGTTDIREVSEILSFEFDDSSYSTIGGFIMSELGRIPNEGDSLDYGVYSFEVIDMDGKRVDKILVKKIVE